MRLARATATCILLAAALAGDGHPSGNWSAGSAQAEPCFGAAARDPESACSNPQLRLKVVPMPTDALLEPSAPCVPVPRRRQPEVCSFGVSPRKARGTVALIGDSHAVHWRAALAVVAAAKRWHGLSVTHSRCPFTRALTPGSRCPGWARRVLRWFRSHPEIGTVIVSGNSGSGVVAARGRSPWATKISGFSRAWRALPPTVRHVFVIRDVPHRSPRAPGCIERALARRSDPGVVCARPRPVALPPDPAAAAARQLRSPRVQALDFTPFMCDAKRCFPVVGGALVIKDRGHLTRTFSTSLGPYLRRELDRRLAP